MNLEAEFDKTHKGESESEAEIKLPRDMLFDLCRVLETQGRLDGIPNVQRAWYAREKLLKHSLLWACFK